MKSNDIILTEEEEESLKQFSKRRNDVLKQIDETLDNLQKEIDDENKRTVERKSKS